MACMELNNRLLQMIITCLIVVAFLLFPALTPARFMAQGGQFTKISDAAMHEEKVMKMRMVIGSKPPRCDGRCRSCGRCEAVQVPILPPKKFFVDQHTAYSRGDDVSMGWKCKCGDFPFDPC